MEVLHSAARSALCQRTRLLQASQKPLSSTHRPRSPQSVISVQANKMQSDSPVSSPDVDFYEECVVADEDVYTPAKHSDAARAGSSSPPVPKANKDSGRVSKKNRGRGRTRSVNGKKSSSQIVLKWLEDNYETIPGACLPRSVLYTHYQDFCKRNHVEPSAAASFGKIIRMKFPSLTTRRLGTRGQSKYHYYGLAIKETSIYYRSIYSKQGLTRFSGASLKKENSQLYNPSSKTGILLPEFPTVKQLNHSKPFPIEKAETFLLMYRAHCQRILDSVVRANFHEVQDFLVHFWQGMPQHVLPILSCQETLDLIIICDFILYNRLCEVLIPANLQQLPDNLIEDILSFSHKLTEWMFNALQNLPAPLGIRKVQVAEMFGKSLRRQTALVQLAKGARAVLRSSESVSCILNEWRSIDFEAAAGQIIFTHQLPEQSIELFKEFAGELEQLLVKQSSMEVYFEWLDSLVERKVCEPVASGLGSLQELSQDFMVAWSSFYLVVEKEVAYLKGKSFDCYRIIHVALNEYIHHVVESLQLKVVESQFSSNFLPSACIGKTQQLSHAPKLEEISGNSSCCGGSLPPIFPPTPTSASSENHDFPYYFENRIITQDFHDPSMYLPTCSSLQSPSYTAALTDSIYDSYFKQEGMYQHSSCMVPTMPPLDSMHSVGQFETTPPPLTPQSSIYSSNSPLSHASIHSPESAAMTPDLEMARPISQGSMCNVESPRVGDVAHTPMLAYSSTSSTCTSPLQHPASTSLDIAASLDLVDGASPGANFMHQDYNMISPSLYPKSATGDLGIAYPMNHTYLPVTNPIMPDSASYSPDNSDYSQYDFELNQFMSDPNDLLTKTIVKDEDIKSSIAQQLQAQTPPAVIQ